MTLKTYKIDLPAFSGPLDLLLHLIERNELDITAVSIAVIADQYLEQIEMLKGNKLEQLMDFLIVGAKLLVIKSRALLPKVLDEFKDDEEEEDPADALARQLRLYKRFKSSSHWLRDREELALRTYLRVAPPPILDQSLDMTGISVESIINAMINVLDRVSLREGSVSVVVEKRIVTIEDQIRRLRHEIDFFGSVQFDDLLSEQISRLEVSVTLLAVLELIKRHEVDVYQPELFGPINIIAHHESEE